MTLDAEVSNHKIKLSSDLVGSYVAKVLGFCLFKGSPWCFVENFCNKVSWFELE